MSAAEQGFILRSGAAPLLISMPHAGTALPADLLPRLTPQALRVADTDWHLPLLYRCATALGASTLEPVYSRYLIDLNRDPSGAALYPDTSNTELCPLSSFACEPLYLPGQAPDAQEVADRVERYWCPYHLALEQELRRMRARHGCALLFEAHSIAAVVPRFFDGRLPDFNFGSNSGASLPDAVLERLVDLVRDDGRWSVVANGRFKGGYLTRHYADPALGLYSLQLELSQAVYMDEQSLDYAWDEVRAGPVQPLLERLLWALMREVLAQRV